MKTAKMRSSEKAVVGSHRRAAVLATRVVIEAGRTLVGEHKGWIILERVRPTDKFTHEAVRPAPAPLFRFGREVLVAQSLQTCLGALERRMWREDELAAVVGKVRKAVTRGK